MVKVERNFGKQDDVTTAGNSGGQRNPSSIAAHDFTHHHAVMTVRSGLQFVECFGGGVDGGQESEGDLCTNNIVVDGLRNANDVHAALHQRSSACHGAITADDDDGIKFMAAGSFHAAIGDVFPHRTGDGVNTHAVAAWIGSVVRSKHGATARENSTDIARAQWANAILNETLKSVFNAEDFNAMLPDGSLGNSSNDCVETGAVAAAG